MGKVAFEQSCKTEGVAHLMSGERVQMGEAASAKDSRWECT